MLFRALLDRLLGTNDSYINQDTAPQSRLSFTAVPNLMSVILRLISPPLDTTKDMLTEGVFPALQLLQRTPPPADQLGTVTDAVLRLTASSQWHIRDKAAKTYAVLIAGREPVVQATRLVTSTYKTLNETHGALLAARYVLESCWSNAPSKGERYFSTTGPSFVSHFTDLDAIGAALQQAARSLYHTSKCPFTKAAFVDLYHDWYRAAYTTAYQPEDEGTLHPIDSYSFQLTLYCQKRVFFQCQRQLN